MTEVIITDPETGGTKGQKPQRLSDLDPLALWELANVAGMGADKYERGNYLKGYNWSLCMDALYRHFLQFQMGEDRDPESGFSHMAHVAWHALALVSFQLRGIGTDDRLPRFPHESLQRGLRDDDLDAATEDVPLAKWELELMGANPNDGTEHQHIDRIDRDGAVWVHGDNGWQWRFKAESERLYGSGGPHLPAAYAPYCFA